MNIAALLYLGVVAAAGPKANLPAQVVSSAPVASSAPAAEADGFEESALPRVGEVPGAVVDPIAEEPPPPGATEGVPEPGVDARDLAATSPDPAMRRYMAAVVAVQTDAHSFVLLLQLALDGDPSVRRAAFNATHSKRCKRETAALCTALLACFMRDSERELAWQARDFLLDRDMDLALEDADKEYKLDLLAKLGGSPVIPTEQARHLLRCLSTDPDSDVQDNAAWLLEQQP